MSEECLGRGFNTQAPSLHVYSAACSWSGPISKVGKTPPNNGISIPCCPHCGAVLFQTDENEWAQGIVAHVAKGHANYDKYIAWSESQSRCWPTFREAVMAFTAETGLPVKWE